MHFGPVFEPDSQYRGVGSTQELRTRSQCQVDPGKDEDCLRLEVTFELIGFRQQDFHTLRLGAADLVAIWAENDGQKAQVFHIATPYVAA